MADSKLKRLLELAIKEEKPIMMDYWEDSIKGKIKIGVKGEDRILIKNDEEYTSPIKTMYNYKDESECIIITENSIYYVSKRPQIIKLN
jgi:hypothetical protein